MIYQVAGLVIAVTAALCGTAIFIADRNQKLIERRQIRARIAAKAQRTFENNSWEMYEDEHQRRMCAEATIAVKDCIISRQDKEIKRLKDLIEKAERGNA